MKIADAALALTALTITVALAAPNYAGLGNRIDPMVLGLPFSLFWNVAWVGVSFFALLIYHLSRSRD